MDESMYGMFVAGIFGLFGAFVFAKSKVFAIICWLIAASIYLVYQ